jgi:deferrochelatase/peroxidase EfeB
VTDLNRRSFLTRSALLGAGGVATAVGGRALESTLASASGAAPADSPGLDDRVAFDGPHQAGILAPQRDQTTYAALDVIAPDTARLVQGLQLLSARARELSRGTSFGPQEVDDPPVDSGTVGPTIAPDGLTVTIAFGASLFDDRYGLAERRPAGLVTMPNFPNDDLDITRSHGDVLVQITANRRDTVVHTLRELMRQARDVFALRWTLDGFQSADRGPTPTSARRNLFGFRDGTSNPDPTDDALMRKLVWSDGTGAEPAWTAGGTYQVVRAIRMHVEFWDRVGLREQETMIGRRRNDGAPVGAKAELDDPRFDLDPKGDRIALDAHIRLANPRTAATADQRILRRAFNYHRGFDAAGQLDQGLIFVACNRDIEQQFATIQKRLSDEPMVDYITPVGGGYFFAPAGTTGPTDWVGSGLFTA